MMNGRNNEKWNKAITLLCIGALNDDLNDDQTKVVLYSRIEFPSAKYTSVISIIMAKLETNGSETRGKTGNRGDLQ